MTSLFKSSLEVKLIPSAIFKAFQAVPQESSKKDLLCSEIHNFLRILPNIFPNKSPIGRTSRPELQPRVANPFAVVSGLNLKLRLPSSTCVGPLPSPHMAIPKSSGQLSLRSGERYDLERPNPSAVVVDGFRL